VDASQLGIEHDWWYRKAAGIGATGTIGIDLVPDKTLSIEVTGEVASSLLTAQAALAHTNREEYPWRLETAAAESEHIDVTGLGQCLNLPYRISGGTGTNGRYSWERDHRFEEGWRLLASATFDEIGLLPITEGDGANTPMSFRDLSIDSDTSKLDTQQGVITVRAKSARMPNLNEPWLLPFDTTPPEGMKLYESNRDWTYFLSADDVLIPPWNGTQFVAEAYSNPDEAGFESYSAAVGEGQIAGTYALKREDNFYSSSVSWDKVPAATLIEHLGFPNVLRGNLSGGIDYKLDKDDPGTLQGQGKFTIVDGQFSADYVASLLQGQEGGDLSAMPPSLKFSEFTGDVVLDKDIVRTPAFSLTSDDIVVTGSGNYVRNGDMDYQIKVALSPATAERIPALRDNLNLQGYRISNQNIELAFRVAGPTFNPKGRVEAMPPVGVTLVSGITSVTSSVIDFPRKILVDLLKMGGGMLAGS
jgi:hypothetical protein